MRLNWFKILAQVGLAILGVALLIAALFAYQLHLDVNGGDWGPNRIAVAWMGCVFIILSAILFFSAAISRWFQLPGMQKGIQWLKIPLLWLFNTNPEDPGVTRDAKGQWLFAVLGAAISIFVAIWYITSGRLVTWTPSTTYFDRQANAFLAGQLALLEQPPAKLASLADPYHIQNRGGINYLWDASYYKGKYYYYWGPVPALLASAGKIFAPAWVVEDQYLIVFSFAGLAITLAALLRWLQKKYFPRLPGWVVMGLTILGALNTPVFWLINHPDVHEVPIAVGELFLILGVFAALRGMDNRNTRLPLLALSAFFWGAAIASRADLAPGIAWMVGLICLYFLLRSANWRLALGAILALALPLLLWGAGLAWYDYARFGNILETGHRYQLTGGAMPADYRNIISASYILPNLYTLLARPLDIHWREFPFLFTPFITANMWPRVFFFPRDKNYFFAEPIAGLFVTIPAIWMFLTALFVPLPKKLHPENSQPAPRPALRDQPLPVWLMGMTAGAALCNLAVLSVFIYNTMRYQADITPLLVILLAGCIGWISTNLHPRSRIWKLVLILLGITILISVSISLLTNFQNGDWIFKNNNPHLYQAIAHFFTMYR